MLEIPGFSLLRLLSVAEVGVNCQLSECKQRSDTGRQLKTQTLAFGKLNGYIKLEMYSEDFPLPQIVF